MKYEIAIFDLDGTILNTLEDLTDTMNFSLKKYGYPQRTIEEVRTFVGNGIHKLVERAVPKDLGKIEIENVFDTFNEHYKDYCAVKTRPYDGAIDMIKKLREKGIITAVVSNKADYAVKLLSEEYFSGLFDFSVGEREGYRKKPYPDNVYAVLDKFGISKEKAVYIGDSEVDYQTAVNADMDVIMVGWGFRDESYIRSLGAEIVIKKPDEILNYI